MAGQYSDMTHALTRASNECNDRSQCDRLPPSPGGSRTFVSNSQGGSTTRTWAACTHGGRERIAPLHCWEASCNNIPGVNTGLALSSAILSELIQISRRCNASDKAVQEKTQRQIAIDCSTLLTVDSRRLPWTAGTSRQQ